MVLVRVNGPVNRIDCIESLHSFSLSDASNQLPSWVSYIGSLFVELSHFQLEGDFIE